MALALKALSGPLENEIFPLKEGLTLGRQGSIKMDDPKVSGIHARIIETDHGFFAIEDNNSKNGIRHEGEKVTTLTLAEGTKFTLGQTDFEVVALTERKPDKPAKSSKKQRYWYDVVAAYLTKALPKFKDSPKPVSPLDPALVLEFVRGVQVNSKWVLGFGPRKVGSTSMDLPIWEPGAPPVCFEILPSNDGLVFKTAHPDIVKLNGQGVDSEVLRMGDTIRIMETLIEVDFAE